MRGAIGVQNNIFFYPNSDKTTSGFPNLDGSQPQGPSCSALFSVVFSTSVGLLRRRRRLRQLPPTGSFSQADPPQPDRLAWCSLTPGCPSSMFVLLNPVLPPLWRLGGSGARRLQSAVTSSPSQTPTPLHYPQLRHIHLSQTTSFRFRSLLGLILEACAVLHHRQTAILDILPALARGPSSPQESRPVPSLAEACPPRTPCLSASRTSSINGSS